MLAPRGAGGDACRGPGRAQRSEHDRSLMILQELWPRIWRTIVTAEPVALACTSDSTPRVGNPATISADFSGQGANGATVPGSTVAAAPSSSEQLSRVLLQANGAIPDARRRGLEPLSPDRFGVHFTADAELRELIERARPLASHRLPNGDLASLFKLMAQTFVRQEEKRRFGLGARRRRSDAGEKVEAPAQRGVQVAKRTASAPSMKVVVEQTRLQKHGRTPPGGAATKGTPGEASAGTPTPPRGKNAPTARKRTRYVSAGARRENTRARPGPMCVRFSEPSALQ